MWAISTSALMTMKGEEVEGNRKTNTDSSGSGVNGDADDFDGERNTTR
jgi:hypothetical protein